MERTRRAHPAWPAWRGLIGGWCGRKAAPPCPTGTAAFAVERGLRAAYVYRRHGDGPETISRPLAGGGVLRRRDGAALAGCGTGRLRGVHAGSRKGDDRL